MSQSVDWVTDLAIYLRNAGFMNGKVFRQRRRRDCA